MKYRCELTSNKKIFMIWIPGDIYISSYTYTEVIEWINTNIVLKAILYNQLPYRTYSESFLFSVITMIWSERYYRYSVQ